MEYNELVRLAKLHTQHTHTHTHTPPHTPVSIYLNIRTVCIIN